VLLITALLGGACGDDDEAARPKPSSTIVEETTSTTQPPGTDPAEVRPYIEDLLARFDDSTNQIVVDPGVAADRNDPLIQAYLRLFEPNSDFAEGAISNWVQNGELGLSTEPFDDSAPPYTTLVDGDLVAVSDDEVTFPTCDKQNYRHIDGQGRPTELVSGQQVQGQGTAVRVDGEWRLRRLDIYDNAPGCRIGPT
jgi:hypothetical protein